MDIASIVRSESHSVIPVLEDIISGKTQTKTICIMGDCFKTSYPLLETLRMRLSCQTCNYSEVVKIVPKGFVLVPEMTIELLAQESELIFRTLATLSREGTILIFDLQIDILSEDIIQRANYFAQTIVSIESDNVFNVIHRLNGGKVRQEQCLLDESKQAFSKLKRESEGPSRSNILPQSTFNLAMTKEQVEAKANVLLPHMRIQLEDLSLDVVNQKSILAHDYDDEDPDDDLDF